MMTDEQLKYANKLKQVLKTSRNKMDSKEFCGIGLIVYSDLSSLPILPLSSVSDISTNCLEENIIEASKFSNICHDGFHMISADWKMTHRNQFFAPPIPKNIPDKLTEKNNVGARYYSALLGSLIDDVICTGIISHNNEVVVFFDGSIY